MLKNKPQKRFQCVILFLKIQFKSISHLGGLPYEEN